MAVSGTTITPIDLDAMMGSAMARFDGQSIEVAETEQQQDHGEPSSEPTAPGDATQEIVSLHPAVTEHEGEADKSPAADDASDAKHADGEERPVSVSHRFTSHDEAERGYREAQAALTRAQQELAQIKKRGIDYAVDNPDVARFIADRQARAVEEIDDIDPDDDNFSTQAAEIWLKANRDIAIFSAGIAADTGTDAPIAPSTDEQTPVIDKTQPPEQQTPPPSPAHDPSAPPEDTGQLLDRVHSSASALGLENPHDDPVFRGYAVHAPTTDGQRQLSLEEQVAWAVKQTMAYREKVASRMRQQQSVPMGRGGSVPAAASPSGRQSAPLTLDGAISRVMTRRVI